MMTSYIAYGCFRVRRLVRARGGQTTNLASIGLSVIGFSVAAALMTSAPAIAQPTPCDGSDINCVYVPYTCNYDVLCDANGNVIPGPPIDSGQRVLLGNGQYCAGNGCTRP